MKKIYKALPGMPDRFTSNDMATATGINIQAVSKLLRRVEELTADRSRTELCCVVWCK